MTQLFSAYSSRTSITLTPGKPAALERVIEILREHKNGDCYAYERGGEWYLGIGTHSSLAIDATGWTATVSAEYKGESHPVAGSLAGITRFFVSMHTDDTRKVFVYVGFTYAAHARGIPYTAGRWPLLSLMIQRVEVPFSRDKVILTGCDNVEVRGLADLINDTNSCDHTPIESIDTQDNAGEYTARVERALAKIVDGKYTKDSVIVEDLMSVRPRGSVQHLGSTVSGCLKPEKDPWDTLEVLFPSITASGIPKQAALEGIQRLEKRPRELYFGAVLLIHGNMTLEAALVLRTVFQDPVRQWVQVGAGVIAQSTPVRELTETGEKLASIAPFVVSETAK
ncbi:putative salicylate synthetase [Aspergillus homomorphus CBS 101889]|uniref:Salicylate synthetase n=1 Tax=Aspergillus homomorphus (strain CBS 101889) TaxID=1450537 RepID=A0A395HYY6_ASPHC|nr:salicylate synthetase [Aspergillus homomorphus CBS 101889]RAL12897.1 salicylate synthetase [Aspergillus homomorphus CBS 101889]